MTQSAETESVTADSLMAGLQREARQTGDPRPVATLARVVEACDDILSGGAARRARAAKEDPKMFDPDFVKLNPRVIGLYIRFRARLDKGPTDWSGPHPSTIRGWKELAQYVQLRAAEATRPGRPKRPSPSSRKTDEIIDGIENMHDRAQLREAVARGRETKRQLDIMVAALRRYPEIDIDALQEGRPFATKVKGPQAQSAVGLEDVKLIRRLVARLRDNDQLDEFDLIFRSGRVKREGGLDLVLPEEISLLERLAGLEESTA
ncbi:hypothetical protein FJ938_23730 [Mesorhizobium sp. B2-4-14]|uniref:hypothetical protein n=1 Tax=Mesorhizobium sp. B2-4-14 TaxID=2589935 RepID=UPI00112D75E8|nr:hypothetical protein [Mesorhizobium sp. B2-4-14]TPK99837.1 hypothetical protein FJ938_23730 [Mesorhizobium sp. B2-4-14]